MRITYEFIMSGRSKNGGWNRPQILSLGVAWPPTAGWIGRIIGSEISDENAQRFIDMRNWLSPRTKKGYRKKYRQAVSRGKKDDAAHLADLRERGLLN